MTLEDYFAQTGAKSMQEVADDSGISYQTIKGAARGMKLVKYDVAKAVSAACTLKGRDKVLVSIEELCE